MEPVLAGYLLRWFYYIIQPSKTLYNKQYVTNTDLWLASRCGIEIKIDTFNIYNDSRLMLNDTVGHKGVQEFVSCPEI